MAALLKGEDTLRVIGRITLGMLRDGRRYRLVAGRMSVPAVSSIGARVGSCAEHELEIHRSLDFVFAGV